MQKTFYHGITAGALSALACIVYSNAYNGAMMTDFSKVVSIGGIIGSCIFGCVLASLGYYFFAKKVTSNTDVWFNIIFLILTFASFVGPFSATLPLDMESPELFAGLTIPMHIFPILFWLATKPLFFKSENSNRIF